MEDDKWIELLKTLEEYAREFKRIYKQKLTNKELVASGKLLNSVEVNVNALGGEYKVILSVEDYFKYVERGRGLTSEGKHTPPYAILRWAQAKDLPREQSNLPRDKQQLSFAFAVARTIDKYGTIKRFNYKGGEPMQETIQELNSRYYKLIADALYKDVQGFVITDIMPRINEVLFSK